MTDTIDLLNQREKSWGNASLTHARIAQVWSGILGHTVTAHDVTLCLAGLKLVRARINPDEPDSLDDGLGYIHIAQEIMGRRSRNEEPRRLEHPDEPTFNEAVARRLAYDGG